MWNPGKQISSSAYHHINISYLGDNEWWFWEEFGSLAQRKLIALRVSLNTTISFKHQEHLCNHNNLCRCLKSQKKMITTSVGPEGSAFERFCWLVCQSQSCCGPHVIKSAWRQRTRNSSRGIRCFPWLIAKQSKSTQTILLIRFWHTKKGGQGALQSGQQLAALDAAQNFCLTVSTEIALLRFSTSNLHL
jgi:hypothetical protein